MGESGGGGGRPGLSGARGGRVGVSAAPVGSGTDIGTRYPTLHRLEADGLLVSEQRVVDGRTRRVYRATEAGKKPWTRTVGHSGSRCARCWDDGAPSRPAGSAARRPAGRGDRLTAGHALRAATARRSA
ncbi:helix-turn-helix transcriptional regulator [Streptomyces anulatus]|uniref:helix-turn-helix transcriptional regulator n=1 Tax=Streptomyces anulatus TaxID=1892 RepID=UPI00362BC823